MLWSIYDFALREVEVAEEKTKALENIQGQVAIYTNAKDKGSVIYLDAIVKSLNAMNIHNILLLPQDMFATAEDFDKSLDMMAQTQSVKAIIVQRPITPNLYLSEIGHLTELARSKEYGWKFVDKKFDEVDTEDEGNYPCTAVALMAATRLVFPDKDKRCRKLATVINRSQNVGRPYSQLLINSQVTTVVCNSKTPKSTLWSLMDHSDIIVTATGVKDLFTSSDFDHMVHDYMERQLIIDIGTPGDISEDLEKLLATPDHVYYLSGKRGLSMLTKAVLLQRIANNFTREE